jgi:hypothetical protein
MSASFIVDVFKNKISCPTLKAAVSLRVTTKQVRDFSSFDTSNVLKLLYVLRFPLRGLFKLCSSGL